MSIPDNGEHLRWHLLTNQREPIVFHNKISSWPSASWTPLTLSKIFGSKRVKFRIGPKDFNDFLWETDCCYEEVTISEFNVWSQGSVPGCSDNAMGPLSKYVNTDHWAYCDYKYIKDLFDEKDFQCADWSVFGFAGRNGMQSTFWMGSAGAHTPCHYDTYGCNLVAQLYGRKRWILFPPSDRENLYPTRVPYEESSVFSQVNMRNPDLTQHCLFKESDRDVRVEEALTRCLVTSLMSQYQPNSLSSWMNPTEDYSPEHDLQYLMEALQAVTPSEYVNEKALPKNSDKHGIASPEAKKRKILDHNTDDKDKEGGGKDPSVKSEPTWSPISSMSAIQYCELLEKERGDQLLVFGNEKTVFTDFQYWRGSTMTSKDTGPKPNVNIKELDIQTLVNCIVHPDVIKSITQVLTNKVARK